MNASPAKLRDGSWGARVQSPDVAEGAVVTITTRAGKSWQARVTRVMWRGDGVSVCATESCEPRHATRRRRTTRDARGNCPRCCYIPGKRTAQIHEDCEYCGAEPVYM